MNELHEDEEGRDIRQRWSQSMREMLAWGLKLFETQYQAGLAIVETALRLPKRSRTSELGGPASTSDKFQALESLALARARKGLALPKEIYRVPYRDRIDWSKYPDWARPIDPELFQETGHEG
jgi:hypothetical protein